MRPFLPTFARPMKGSSSAPPDAGGGGKFRATTSCSSTIRIRGGAASPGGHAAPKTRLFQGPAGSLRGVRWGSEEMRCNQDCGYAVVPGDRHGKPGLRAFLLILALLFPGSVPRCTGAITWGARRPRRSGQVQKAVPPEGGQPSGGPSDSR